MVSFIGHVINGFLSLDPLFGSMPWKTTEHSGPIRNVRGPSPLDQSMPEIRSMATMDTDSIRNTDIENFARFLYDLARSNIKAFAPEFFKGLSEIIDAAGTTTYAGGQPFSFDMLNDTLEKMQLEFDEDGEPVFPTLITHPLVYEQIKQMKPTPEQEQRLSEIIARKKAEHDAKKRTRRLS